MPLRAATPRPRGHHRYGGPHRHRRRTSRQIEEDLRRMGADLCFRRGRGHQRDFVRRPRGFFERACLAWSPNWRSMLRFPPTNSSASGARLIEGLRIERTTPAFSPASACAAFCLARIPTPRFRRPKRKSKPTARAARGVLPARTIARKRAAGDRGRFRAAGNARRRSRTHFRFLDGGAVAPPPDPALPALHGRRVYFVHLPGAVQTQILLGIAPSRASIPTGCA